LHGVLVGEERKQRLDAARQRDELEGRLGDEGQRSLRAHDHLGQVVPAGRLHELAAAADDLARRQDGLQPDDVVARHAVLHGAHAAGVGGHVAAEAGAVLAGNTG